MNDAFYALDRNWRYTYINRAAEAYYGQPRQSMLGKPIWNFVPWTTGQDLKTRYEHAMRSRTSVTFEAASVVRPDRYYEVNLFPYDDGIGVKYRDRTERKLAEEALRESETRLEIATAAAELGIWDWNLLTNEVIYSDRARSIHGFPGDGPVTVDMVRAATHPEDMPRVSATTRRALSPELREKTTYQYRVIRPTGTVRWVMTHGEAIFGIVDGKERAIRYVGTFQDITARKEAEAALEESEARLTAVADNIPLSMIYQIVSSRDGSDRRFVYVSRACLSVNGISAEDVLRDPDLLYRLVLPEHGPVLAAAESKALQTLEPMDVELAIRHAVTGEVRWCRLIWAPRPTPDGDLIWDGVQIDVTERRLAEESVRASEERLRMLLERMPVGVALAKIPTGVMLFQNATSMKLLGSRLPDGNPPKRANAMSSSQDVYPFLQTILRGEVVDQEEVIYLRDDGATIHLSVSSAPIDGFGDETLAMSTFHDITERTRAEEHLRLLVNELNHRVKNTLATVQSIGAQSFRDVKLSDESATAAAKRAFEERLFALARAHDVLTRENWESASLRETVNEALAPYRGNTTGDDPFEISGDDIRLMPQKALSLSMALHELCTNAVKHGALSHQDGRVRLGWSERDVVNGKAITIRWEERGGPPVRHPVRRGFGTRLIERGLARELNGKVHLSYEPTGVICVIDVPKEGALYHDA
jgi:PAS domain S-box-containing protein